MNLVIKLNEDAELRSFTKDLIRGQVRSIAREEILEILREELRNKTPDINPNDILKQEVISLARATLDRGSWSNPTFIQQVAREEINKLIKEKLGV